MLPPNSIGAPLLGRLSDRYGRRPVLLISILGTALGFLLLGVAEPLGMAITRVLPAANQTPAAQNTIILVLLFASRILDGLTGGNISVAQAYITDTTDAGNCAQGLGLIGAAFGLGFIFGPAVGGALSVFGYAVPAYTAAGLASLNLVAVLPVLGRIAAPGGQRQIHYSAKPVFNTRLMGSPQSATRVALCSTSGSPLASDLPSFRQYFPYTPSTAWGLMHVRPGSSWRMSGSWSCWYRAW